MSRTTESTESTESTGGLTAEGTVTDGWLLGSVEAPVVVIDRVLAATPEEVWAAWTVPAQLRRWLGAVAGPLDRPGAVVPIAMAAEEPPADWAAAENPAAFTVREAAAPSGRVPGRLVLVFDDAADPGGLLTVTMTAADGDRCRLHLTHRLLPREGAHEQAAGFGAGWEGFLDWLAEVLDGHAHGGDETYDEQLPTWEQRAERLRRTPAGRVEDGVVVHERRIAAPAAGVWGLLVSAGGLARWLGAVVGPAATAVGERLSVVHAADDPEDHVQTSLVEEWEPHRVLAMTWAFPGEPTSRLRVTLAESDGGTVLHLAHTGVADTGSYRAGWGAHLDLLAAAAEGWRPPTFADALAAAGDGPD